MNYIAQIDSLFKRKWMEISANWENRGEDYYKTLFVFPTLSKVLDKYIPSAKKNIKIADFGCGDGCLTELIVKDLIRKANPEKVELVGIDISKNLLFQFQEKLGRINKIRVKTYTLDLTVPFNIKKKFDLIITSFVFHDVVNINHLIKNIRKHIMRDGLHINIMIDPLFSEVMYHKGVLKTIVPSEINVNNLVIWRRITEFPVITASGEIIYVPHVHRYFGDYLNVLRNNELIPLTIEHFTAKDENLLKDYYPFKDNKIYTPEIFNFPSLNLIISSLTHK